MQTSGIHHLPCCVVNLPDCCVYCDHSCSRLQKWHWSHSVSDFINHNYVTDSKGIDIHNVMNRVSMHVCNTCFLF